jgi:hypothetical protein
MGRALFRRGSKQIRGGRFPPWPFFGYPQPRIIEIASNGNQISRSD